MFYRAPKDDPFYIFVTLTFVNAAMVLLTSLTTMVILLGLSLSMKITNNTPVGVQAIVVSAAIWLYICLAYVQRKMIQGLREWLVRKPKQDEEETNEGGQG